MFLAKILYLGQFTLYILTLDLALKVFVLESLKSSYFDFYYVIFILKLYSSNLLIFTGASIKHQPNFKFDNIVEFALNLGLGC